jgi:hypothetical protein
MLVYNEGPKMTKRFHGSFHGRGAATEPTPPPTKTSLTPTPPPKPPRWSISVHGLQPNTTKYFATTLGSPF